MHTRQNIFFGFSRKKRPLRENAHTAKKCSTIVFFFFRERNFYVLQIFTSDNYIFHWEKQLFFVHNFLARAEWNLLTPQQSLLTPQWSLPTAQWSLLRAQ